MTMKWNSRPGRRATGTPGTDKAGRAGIACLEAWELWQASSRLGEKE